MKLHIVLHEPEIPQNTGNIARTCAAINADLHLIHPLGFSLDEKYVRRAGLDYWSDVTIHEYQSWSNFTALQPERACYFFTTKATQLYSQIAYPPEAFIVFGKETAGIPEHILAANRERCVRIPMIPNLRSLNLSNAVAVGAYEILRQHNFPGLDEAGKGF